MATKYILHGGNIRGATDAGKYFFEEIVKDLGDKPRLLLCFFAQSEELWEEKYQEWTSRILKTLDSINPSFEMASEDKYEQQAASADALFVYGGDCDLLLGKAKNTKGFIESLSKIKVVAGSSAGAILLSKFHWCCDDRESGEGIGMVPINCMVHYRSTSYSDGDPRGPIDWDAAEKSLEALLPTGETITHIPEGKFVVIEK